MKSVVNGNRDAQCSALDENLRRECRPPPPKAGKEKNMLERRMEAVKCIVTAPDATMYIYTFRSEADSLSAGELEEGVARDGRAPRIEFNELSSIRTTCPAVGHAIFQSNILRGLSHCSRIMAPALHACRADYVTYCNAWNVYKTKAIPRARDALPRFQRFHQAMRGRPRRKYQHIKREKEEVRNHPGGWDRNYNAREHASASLSRRDNRLSGITQSAEKCVNNIRMKVFRVERTEVP